MRRLLRLLRAAVGRCAKKWRLSSRVARCTWGRHDGAALLTIRVPSVNAGKCSQPAPRAWQSSRTQQQLLSRNGLKSGLNTQLLFAVTAAALPLPLALFSFSSTNGSDVPTGRSAGGRSSQLRMRGWCDVSGAGAAGWRRQQVGSWWGVEARQAGEQQCSARLTQQTMWLEACHRQAGSLEHCDDDSSILGLCTCGAASKHCTCDKPEVLTGNSALPRWRPHRGLLLLPMPPAAAVLTNNEACEWSAPTG